MFRKLITNLSFSPSLISEVAIYAKKLKVEESHRRISLIIIIPALILQIFAAVKPPESTNKTSEQDLVYGGISNIPALLDHYDKNELNLRDIFSTLGISRLDISNLKPEKLNSKTSDNLLVVGTQPITSYEEGGRVTNFKKHNGGMGGLYLTPLKHNQAKPTTYEVLSGEAKSTGKFYIINNSGAIIISKIPKSLTIKEADSLYLSKKVHNNTQNQENPTAAPSDRITYTLTAKNTDKKQPQNFTFVEKLSDVLEYADVTNTHGGTLDVRAQIISWPETTIAPGESQQRKFTIRLKTHLPATAIGQSNPNSFDCIMRNNFGNTILTPVQCPLYKYAEQAASELPTTKSSTSITVGLVILTIAVLLYLRSLQYKEEIRLIRRDVNEGLLL